MTAALIDALRRIADLPLNSDADVLRDTVVEARQIAAQALAATPLPLEGLEAALIAIRDYPANGNSDPDDMEAGLEYSQTTAAKVLRGEAFDPPPAPGE